MEDKLGRGMCSQQGINTWKEERRKRCAQYTELWVVKGITKGQSSKGTQTLEESAASWSLVLFSPWSWEKGFIEVAKATKVRGVQVKGTDPRARVAGLYSLLHGLLAG